MKILTLFLATCITSFVFGQNTKSSNAEWVVSSSSVKFKIKNAGLKVDGTFTGLSAKIIFDDSKMASSLIEASIDSKSINTGNNTRDGHLKKKEYFDVDNFPKISMKATVFSKEKDGTYKGYFKLMMKDKSKDFFIPFTFSQKDGKGVFNAKFTIDRLDYGVGESSMILSDNVSMEIQINVVQK